MNSQFLTVLNLSAKVTSIIGTKVVEFVVDAAAVGYQKQA